MVKISKVIKCLKRFNYFYVSVCVREVDVYMMVGCFNLLFYVLLVWEGEFYWILELDWWLASFNDFLCLFFVEFYSFGVLGNYDLLFLWMLGI